MSEARLPTPPASGGMGRLPLRPDTNARYLNGFQNQARHEDICKLTFDQVALVLPEIQMVLWIEERAGCALQ
jgi:hypothetical protein